MNAASSTPIPASSTGADREAIARALAHERGGATLLHAKYGRLVRAVLRRFVTDAATLEDLSQEAFSSAFRSLSRLKDVRKLPAWLATIAERAYYRCLRDRAAPAPWVSLDTVSQDAALVDPAADLERLLRVRDLRASIGHLPDPYRLTLLQRFYDELPLAAIATRQGIQLPLAKYRVQQGLRLLKVQLSRDGLTASL